VIDDAPEPVGIEPEEQLYPVGLPINVGAREAQRLAAEAFTAALVRRLSNFSVEFRVTPEGDLVSRPRRAGANITRVEVGPTQVYNECAALLRSMGLRPPSKSRERQHVVEVGRPTTVRESRAVRTRLFGLLRNLGIFGRPAPTPPPNADAAPATTDQATEFAELRGWLNDRLNDGTLSEALVAWHRTLLDAERPRPWSRALVPADGEFTFLLRGTKVRVAVGGGATSATVVPATASIGAEVRVTVRRRVAPYAGRDLLPSLDGVVFHFLPDGMSVVREAGVEPLELSAAPSLTSGAVVGWDADEEPHRET
jgi:hypothetical protein